MRSALHTIISLAAALVVVMLMAFQCAEPLPPPPTPTPPEPDPVSESLKAFLQKSEIGLYIDTEGIVLYDEFNYQKAWSVDGGYFRIQRDDQSAYLNVKKASQSASSSYQVEYLGKNNEVTLMLLKLQSVQTENSRVWLWNETMKTGVIIPEGSL
ncbi:MAG: hypothetical protein IKX60_07325 [Bacteroidales bacterium]|nr:hypothetical protein [Bacteroidales bacterium]